MMDSILLKKLNYSTGMSAISFGGMDPLLAHKGILVQSNKEADILFFFARQSADLESSFSVFYSRVKEGGLIWILFPKKSAGMQSDLSRDRGWEPIDELGLKPLTLISFDDTWSAFGCRKQAGMSFKKWETEVRNQKPKNPYIDFEKRVITPPTDLEDLFLQHPEAGRYFENLAFSHKKEYIEWICDAKRDETRLKRLMATIEKLESGLKNPSMK
jgi:hypothetical protein